MLEILLRRFVNYRNTCPINNIEDKSVTFIRDEKYLPLLRDIKEDIILIAHKRMESKIREYQEAYCPTVNAYYTDYPEYEFTIYHNCINKSRQKSCPNIGNNCNIHPSVIIGVDGMKVVNTPNGEKINFIHTGHVLILDNVNIGAYTVIHRGTMGITIIKEGCNIGSLCNIGHNCSIGTYNILAANVVFSGGVFTGSNCWFGSGSIVKHKVTITDNVVVGMGAVVTKDIKKSGVYVGNPARFLKEHEEGWNF